MKLRSRPGLSLVLNLVPLAEWISPTIDHKSIINCARFLQQCTFWGSASIFDNYSAFQWKHQQQHKLHKLFYWDVAAAH